MGILESGVIRPANLVVDRKTREDMLERLFGLACHYEAKSLALKILEALGRLGMNWRRTRKVLKLLREEVGVKVADEAAHKVWKRGYGTRTQT